MLQPGSLVNILFLQSLTHLIDASLFEVVAIEYCAHDVVKPLFVGLQQCRELHVRKLLVDQDHVHINIL